MFSALDLERVTFTMLPPVRLSRFNERVFLNYFLVFVSMCVFVQSLASSMHTSIKQRNKQTNKIEWEQTLLSLVNNRINSGLRDKAKSLSSREDSLSAELVN